MLANLQHTHTPVVMKFTRAVSKNGHKTQPFGHSMEPCCYIYSSQNPQTYYILQIDGSFLEIDLCCLSMLLTPTLKTWFTHCPCISKTLQIVLNKLNDYQLDCNDILCTMDISGLYPSIPHKDGL